jgi:transposase
MSIQRVEVITGTGGRRRFSDEQKQQLVEEAFQPGVKATEVARRHGMDVSLLYRWRRMMFGRRPRLPGFTPVSVVNTAASELPPISTPPEIGTVEIEFAGGTRMRVTGTVSASTLASIVAALTARPA